MAETNEQDEKRQAGKCCLFEFEQPPQGLAIESDPVFQRAWWKLEGPVQNCDHTPDDQDDHHRGCDRHDLQGLLAGLMKTLSILPPEINDDDDGKARREAVFGESLKGMAGIAREILEESSEILTGDYGTQGAVQHVIKEQSGDRELRQRTAQGAPHHTVYAPAH